MAAKKPEISSYAIKNPEKKWVFILAVIALGILGIYVAYYASFLGLISQILFALIVLVISGNLIRFYGGFMGWNAMYLLSTKKGINFIDMLSKKYQRFWLNLPLWGIVLGLGLLSWPFLKGKINKKLFAFSMISLYLMFAVVSPYTIAGVQLITLPQIQTLVQNLNPSPQFLPSGNGPYLIVDIILYAVVIIGGFTGYIVAALAFNSLNLIYGIIAFLITVFAGHPQTSALSNQIPGVIPVIPGITIPLVAGLISLLILLVVHEGSHGVLARIAKVKIKSVGLLMFGAVPIGAFVEPDEKQVMKLDSMAQTRIFAAGSGMNFLFAFVFFVLVYLCITYMLPGISAVFIATTVQGEPAYNVLQPGMQILQWNGYPIKNSSSFNIAEAGDTPNSIVTVVTNTGTYQFTALSKNNSAKGYIGITPAIRIINTPTANFEYFIYTILALSLTFNFFVALFNLLPIPAFDGWRIYKSNIKSEKVVKYLAYFLVVLVLLNVVTTVLKLLIP